VKIERLIYQQVVPFLTNVSSFRYLQIIKQVFTLLMPIFITISIVYLGIYVPNNFWQVNIMPLINMMVGYLIFLLPILIIITTAYLAENWYQDAEKKVIKFEGIILALLIFLLLTDYLTVAKNFPKTNYIWLSLLTSIASCESLRLITKLCGQIKSWKKLPSMVISTLTNIFSLVITMLFWLVLIGIFKKPLNGFVLLLQVTILSWLDNPLWVFAIVGINRILWAFGVHGSNLFNSFIDPFFVQMSIINFEAFYQQKPLTYTYTSIFIDTYIWLGLLPVALLLCLQKNKEVKELGKHAIIPACFNISEQLMYGLPIVKNVKLGWSFVISYLLITVIAINAQWLGKIVVPVLFMPYFVPIPIRTFLATVGNIPALLFVLAMWLLIACVFYPITKLLANEKR